VLGEEFGELTKAMVQLTYEPHKTSAEEVKIEAIQTVAMALRLHRSLDQYEYRPGAQHKQNAPLSETPAGGTAKVQEWKEISADKLLGWEEAECEKQELKAVIKSAYLDLAALCPNPSDDDPDFETCLGRRNSADEECLVRAYLALRAMLAAAPSPDGNEESK
jgi:hypothetical protein